MENFQDAMAHLVVYQSRRRTQFGWRIQTCPYCEMRHNHGGGLSPEDPRAYLSWRAAHCMHRPHSESGWSYRLRDVNPERTIQILRGLGYKIAELDPVARPTEEPARHG